MTSLDDDGSTQDEARRTSPADPWLTEAPTSAFSDAPTPPPPDVTKMAPYPDWYQQPRPGRRRGRRLLVAVLAVIAVLIAGRLAIDQFGSDDDNDSNTAGPRPTAAKTTTAVQPAANPPATTSAAPSPTPAALQVVYEITASGAKNTGSIAYTDQDGQIIRRNGIPLPWRTTFTAGDQRKPLILDAQRKGGGDAGPMTCTITVDGKVLASTTAEGRYASALCSGSA
ncbi:MmpS family transport accessory protein [Actinoplanes sp. NPDC026670]|uniref:MmpS family transport accessory protein n=1 Tax=Actinoplanes sp. NPDC026670 TaxID=3154700 RepID=UPI00340FFE9A